MNASYSELSAKGSMVGDVAQRLREGGPSCRLSPLVFMTEPNRVSDPVKTVSHLPKGTAIIYRHFGSPDHARDLRDLTREREQQLLIGKTTYAASNQVISRSRAHTPQSIEWQGEARRPVS